MHSETRGILFQTISLIAIVILLHIAFKRKISLAISLFWGALYPSAR